MRPHPTAPDREGHRPRQHVGRFLWAFLPLVGLWLVVYLTLQAVREYDRARQMFDEARRMYVDASTCCATRGGHTLRSIEQIQHDLRATPALLIPAGETLIPGPPHDAPHRFHDPTLPGPKPRNR